MKKVFIFAIVVVFMSVMISACGSLAPAISSPQVETGTSTGPGLGTATAPATATAIPAASPTPTTGLLPLEIVQSQVWTDRDGNLRANVLLRNPNDFPVAPLSMEGANLLDGTGQLVRSTKLYYLDGISGGNGFFLPGETITANA